jgi:hypothetical protein
LQNTNGIMLIFQNLLVAARHKNITRTARPVKICFRVLPFKDLGCVDTLYTVISKIDNGFRLNLVDTVHGCANTGADLTTAYVTDGSSPGMKYTYFVDGDEKSQVSNPKAILTSGIYYIKGINDEGCESILPIHVKIETPSY